MKTFLSRFPMVTLVTLVPEIALHRPCGTNQFCGPDSHISRP